MEMLAAVIQFQIYSSSPQASQLSRVLSKKNIISNYSASDSHRQLRNHVQPATRWRTRPGLVNWEMTRLPRPAMAAGSPDSKPAWALIQQAAGINQQIYQVSGEINRGFLGEIGDCCQITSKSTIIYTSKIIIFHKNTILFIYIQILQFYGFCLFFEYCRKSHICKNTHL